MRLTASSGDASDDADGVVRAELATGVIIEEEERFGAVTKDVIGAHGHQVDANRLILIQDLRQFDLRDDAIGAGNQ